MNDVLKEYYKTFDEFPYLLMTQNYDSDDYKTLMIIAINRGKKLTEQEIGDFFNNNYDLVIDNANIKNDGENNMNEQKIRKLLAQYGAEESEIENFMNDLNDTKEELEEDVADEDYVLNQDTIDKLKETQDGINLLIKAPEMAKEELKKAIADYLQK